MSTYQVSNGRSTIRLPTEDLTSGNYKVHIKYKENQYYKTAEAQTTLQIQRPNTTIIPTDTTNGYTSRSNKTLTLHNGHITSTNDNYIYTPLHLKRNTHITATLLTDGTGIRGGVYLISNDFTEHVGQYTSQMEVRDTTGTHSTNNAPSLTVSPCTVEWVIDSEGYITYTNGDMSVTTSTAYTDEELESWLFGWNNWNTGYFSLEDLSVTYY